MEDIIKWINKNPTKDSNIEPITIKIYSDTNENDNNPLVGPGGIGVVPLDPPGPLSLYLWHNNPEYRAGNFLTRKIILRELIVSLNIQFDSELRGRVWNRTKVISQLQEQESSAISPPQKTPELNKAICFCKKFQYIEIDEIHKKVFWYPSDIREWSSEFPVYLASYGCRSIYVKKNAEVANSFINEWIATLQKLEYSFSWPTTEGTVKELKEKMIQYELSISKTKPLKEDYSIIIGKAEAIFHLSKEFITK